MKSNSTKISIFVLALIIVFQGICLSVKAQDNFSAGKDAIKVEESEYINNEMLSLHLDIYLQEIEKMPDAVAHIIIYRN
ncbi:MAG TPA: hypothetical protein VEX64_10855, partial [Pyrinomonadaceae bacterium]|nr:hypothetical protein [Pyrinomonadaceae bacterium]